MLSVKCCRGSEDLGVREIEGFERFRGSGDLGVREITGTLATATGIAEG